MGVWESRKEALCDVYSDKHLSVTSESRCGGAPPQTDQRLLLGQKRNEAETGDFPPKRLNEAFSIFFF